MSDEINDFKLRKLDLDDVDGNVNVFNKAQWYRLMKWKDKVEESSGNRNVDYALDLVNSFSVKLGLDGVVRRRIYSVYSGSVDAGVLTGRSIEGVVGASVYVGLRLEGVVRTAEEVSEVCKVSYKDLLRTSKLICKKLGVRLPLLSPKDFVPRFCDSLGIVDDDVVLKAYELLDDCEVVGLCNGPAPNSLAASCLYLACLGCGVRKTQRDVGEVCGVSEVTIRNNLRKIRKTLELDY